MGELPDGFVMPDTVQAVVAARIDLLDPAEKEALQAASVIGRIFWSGPVYELCPDADPDLRQLEQRDFVRLRLGSSIEGEREYVIKHAVTREVAYASIPKARRARLHAAFAEWVERFAGRRDEYAAILAHHYTQAASPEDADLAWAGEAERLRELRQQAVEWLRRAAELAIGRYEIDEGLALLHRALELEPARADQSAIWHEIGRAHALKYDGEPFWAAMQTAIELSDDPLEIADMYSDLARETVLRVGMWRQTPDPEQIEEWIERALELVPDEGPTRVKALVARALWGGTATGRGRGQRHRRADRRPRPALLGADDPVQRRLSRAGLRAVPALVRARVRAHRHRLRPGARGRSGPRLPSGPPSRSAASSEARQLGARVHDMNLGLTTAPPRARGRGADGGRGAARRLGAESGGCEPRRRRRSRRTSRRRASATRARCCSARWRRRSPANRAAANALLERAEELRMEGHGLVLEGPRVRLALLRGRPRRRRRLLGDRTTRRQARDRVPPRARSRSASTRSPPCGTGTRVEEEAPELLRPGTYLEPFALRALGIVREDEALHRAGPGAVRRDGPGVARSPDRAAPPRALGYGAGVRPWRRITAPIAARSGGPPAAASTIAARSRK